MRTWLWALLTLGALSAPVLATDYTVALSTTANEDVGLGRLYRQASKDRTDEGLPPLAGCNADSTVCTPTQAELESAMSVLLRNQLKNAYSNMLDREGRVVGQKYSTLTPAQQTAIRAQCPTCEF